MQTMDLPLDVLFFVYQRREQLRASKAASKGVLTVEHRIKLDALKAVCDTNILAAHGREAELWSELCGRKPSLAKLDSLGIALMRHTAKVATVVFAGGCMAAGLELPIIVVVLHVLSADYDSENCCCLLEATLTAIHHGDFSGNSSYIHAKSVFSFS